jgi:hypothetical protein
MKLFWHTVCQKKLQIATHKCLWHTSFPIFILLTLKKESASADSARFLAHIWPDSSCGRVICPKASHTVQSFDPATSQTWKDTVFSRLTLQINVLFRLRIGRCRMDGIRYYRTTSNLLWVEHKVVSSIIFKLTCICVLATFSEDTWDGCWPHPFCGGK